MQDLEFETVSDVREFIKTLSPAKKDKIRVLLEPVGTVGPGAKAFSTWATEGVGDDHEMGPEAAHILKLAVMAAR